MIEAKKIVALNSSGKVGDYKSIKDAAKILFKGSRKAMVMIQKSCSGHKKSPLKHELLGDLIFRYKL